VLVAGGPDDRKTSAKVLETAARAYEVTPLLFPGIGHDFMNDAGWQAPLDAILDWLDDKQSGEG
ncbi:MAG: alpha/beta hydrolase, partial [Stackebrandtia sp.]